MTITRVHAEILLIRRLGGLLDAVGLDGTTIEGSNQDLNDPLAWALRQLGLTVDDVTQVVDADLANVADADLDQFLDLAELRVLETTYNAAAGLVDLAVGPRKESFSQVAQRLETRIERKRSQIAQDYGTLGSILEGAVIQLNFAEHDTGAG